MDDENKISSIAVNASTWLYEKCSVTACSHTVAMAHERWSGCDTSKSDHKTVARKHKGSKCREGIRTAAV